MREEIECACRKKIVSPLVEVCLRPDAEESSSILAQSFSLSLTVRARSHVCVCVCMCARMIQHIVSVRE